MDCQSGIRAGPYYTKICGFAEGGESFHPLKFPAIRDLI